MPSHKIHLGIAQEVNKKIKLDSDAIKLGSILPDLTIKHNHGLSHFQYENVYPLGFVFAYTSTCSLEQIQKNYLN